MIERQDVSKVGSWSLKLIVKKLTENDAHLIVCLIEPIFNQRVINQKLIYNINSFVLQELEILLGGWLAVELVRVD